MPISRYAAVRAADSIADCSDRDPRRSRAMDRALVPFFLLVDAWVAAGWMAGDRDTAAEAPVGTARSCVQAED